MCIHTLQIVRCSAPPSVFFYIACISTLRRLLSLLISYTLLNFKTFVNIFYEISDVIVSTYFFKFIIIIGTAVCIVITADTCVSAYLKNFTMRKLYVICRHVYFFRSFP